MNLPVQHQDALEQRRNHSRAGCSTPPYQKLTGITKNAAKRQGHPIALHSTITWRASRQPWLQHYKARIATFLTCWDVTSLSCLGESRLILLQSIFHEPIRVFLGFDVVGFFSTCILCIFGYQFKASGQSYSCTYYVPAPFSQTLN